MVLALFLNVAAIVAVVSGHANKLEEYPHTTGEAGLIPGPPATLTCAQFHVLPVGRDYRNDTAAGGLMMGIGGDPSVCTDQDWYYSLTIPANNAQRHYRLTFLCDGNTPAISYIIKARKNEEPDDGSATDWNMSRQCA